MTFVGLSPRSICLLCLATLGLALGQTCVPSENPSCTQDESDIGDPYASGQGNRKLLQASKATVAPPQSLVPVLTNRRSLLQSMCSDTDNSPSAVIQCTNAVRSSPRSFDIPCGINENGGLGPLSMNEELMEAAEKHSKDNAQMGDLTHKGSDGSWASTRVRRTGYSAGMVRENIAYGFLSSKAVVFGWMCSSGHRKNIMSCDTADIGVGLAKGYNGRYYHTQVFACPQGQQCTCSGGGGGGSEEEEEEEKPVASPVEGGGHQPAPYQEYPYPPYHQIPFKKTDKKPHGGAYYYDYPPYYGYGTGHGSGHGTGPSHSGGEEEEKPTPSPQDPYYTYGTGQGGHGSGHGSGPSHSGGEEEEKPTPSPQDPYYTYGTGQGGHGGHFADPYGAAKYKDGPYIHVAHDGHPIESHSGYYVTLSTMPGHGQYATPGGHSGDD